MTPRTRRPGGTPVGRRTHGYESILDALAGLAPKQTLTWHYRSRDERLIAFSNAHLYDNSLSTFPGVEGVDVIGHVRAEATPGNAGSRQESSGAEVDRVVELVLEHARVRPG